MLDCCWCGCAGVQIWMLDASKMVVERLPRRLAGDMLRESVPENLDILLWGRMM